MRPPAHTRSSAFARSSSLFAGRELDVDDAVHASEALTGNRNRAIAWLLRNYLVLQDDVDAVLDTYFRQCAILITARDLAIMAATLANRGVNPVTGAQVISPNIVARTLSVMTSSGMYDYAGEWIYRVGIPAKSGVGGGIVAALPSQLTFSPCLDSHGCKNVLKRSAASTCICRADVCVIARLGPRAAPPAARAALARDDEGDFGSMYLSDLIGGRLAILADLRIVAQAASTPYLRCSMSHRMGRGPHDLR